MLFMGAGLEVDVGGLIKLIAFIAGIYLIISYFLCWFMLIQ